MHKRRSISILPYAIIMFVVVGKSKTDNAMLRDPLFATTAVETFVWKTRRDAEPKELAQ